VELPVSAWFDEQAASALREYNELRRRCRRGRDPPRWLLARRSVARQRYRRLRATKMACFAQKWARFWEDVRCNHVSVWRVIRGLSGGGGGLQCACAAEVQRDHYASVGRIRLLPSYDVAAACAAQAWMACFIREGRGLGSRTGFSESMVAKAYSRLHEGAPGVDGLSKRWAAPLLTVLLPEVTALFSFVVSRGTCPEDWALAVVASIKKKGHDNADMNNFRGVHILAFMRQWYASCLLEWLEELCAKVVPPEQQGFVKGGRIYASFLALYALIELARISDERLFVAFVDVKKAFPTVNRTLLFHKLSKLGAPDFLIRALWALYEGACGSVRNRWGFGELFEILFGTREGGVESPLLYVLFAADLVPQLGQVELGCAPPLLAGRPIRALQLADDIALIARSPEDLQCLIDRWEAFCDANHQETSIAKTETVVYTTGEDEHCRGCGSPRIATAGKFGAVAHSGLHLPGARPSESGNADRIVEFLYKGERINVADAFVYLGILFCFDEVAEAAYRHRAAAGTKALGAVKSSLRLAPFLPFHRTVEVGESTTGGAYLYGAEMWAPFLPIQGSAVGRQYFSWLHGFGRARLSRMRGWFLLRELDTQAEARSIRVIEDACSHGGLLALAVGQFLVNWESVTDIRYRREQLWLGKFLHMVHRTWPGFRIAATGGRVEWHGGPENNARERNGNLSKCYVEAVRCRLWRERQVTVLCKKPKPSQQDYLLACIIRSRNRLCPAVGCWQDLGRFPTTQERKQLNVEPIFDCKPGVSTAAIRTLLRFLAGLADFARCNAHFKRKKSHRIFLIEDRFRRLCLSCLVRRKVEVLDSEWHALFECPLNQAPRALFSYAHPLHQFGFPEANALDCLIALVLQSHTDERLTDDFALWVVGTIACRRQEFTALAPP